MSDDINVIITSETLTFDMAAGARALSAYEEAVQAGYAGTEEEYAELMNALTIDLSMKQDTLVSATNIKTVGNKSVLGAGDIGLTSNDVPDSVNKRYITDAERTDWNSKATGTHNHDSDYSDINHNHDLAYEPLKGTDDNFVTDAEKANLHAPHSDDQDLSGLVPKTTTVNGKALNGNISLDYSDVGASASGHTHADLHTHANKTALDAVSGTNTGDQDLSGLVSKKTSVEVIVSAPNWANQPTISGNLDATFLSYKRNFYYVTLKDTNGATLPSNQFKLMESSGGYATAVNQIFTLASLNTGSATLAENDEVDFSEIGANWKLRYSKTNAVIISNLPSRLQTGNLKINITGMVNQNYYLYLKPLGGFDSTNYFGATYVGTGYSMISGLLFPPNTSPSGKFVWINRSFILTRKKNSLAFDFSYIASGSTTLGGAASMSVGAGSGVMFSLNEDAYPVENTPITGFKIHLGESTRWFRNGVQVIIETCDE